MTWSPWREPRVRAAAVFVAVAVLIATQAMITAMRDDVVLPAPSLRWTTDSMAVRAPRAAAVSFASLDPFGEDRATPVDASRSNSPAALPVTLVGTVAGVPHPTAVCSLGAQSPRILHVGDTLGGWRLQQVMAGRVIFVDANGAPRELRLSSLGK